MLAHHQLAIAHTTQPIQSVPTTPDLSPPLPSSPALTPLNLILVLTGLLITINKVFESGTDFVNAIAQLIKRRKGQ